MQQMRDDLHADFAALSARLAEMVTKIQYDAVVRTEGPVAEFLAA